MSKASTAERELEHEHEHEEEEQGEGSVIGDDDTSDLVSVTGESIEDAKAEVVNQKDADQVRVRVIQLRDQMSDGYFEMGRLLHRVSRQGLYTQWRSPNGKRYETFREYIEHEVEFAFRKAKHLMSIWWWFAEELKDPSLPEKVKVIGWTKAAMLVGVANKNNADAWIQKAKDLSATQLGDETRRALEHTGTSRRPARPTSRNEDSESDAGVSTSLGTQAAEDIGESIGAPITTNVSSDEQEDARELEQPSLGADPLTAEENEKVRTKWVVKLNGLQRQNVETAIDEASRIAEVEGDGKGYLLDLIATSFLAQTAASGRMSSERKANMRNDMILSLQRALGIDIVAFEAGSANCIFGEKTLSRIAEMAEAEGS